MAAELKRCKDCEAPEHPAHLAHVFGKPARELWQRAGRKPAAVRRKRINGKRR